MNSCCFRSGGIFLCASELRFICKIVGFAGEHACSFNQIRFSNSDQAGNDRLRLAQEVHVRSFVGKVTGS